MVTVANPVIAAHREARARIEAAVAASIAAHDPNDMFAPEIAHLSRHLSRLAHMRFGSNDDAYIAMQWEAALRGRFAGSFLRAWLATPTGAQIGAARISVLRPVTFHIGHMRIEGEVELYCDADGTNADLGEFVLSSLFSAHGATSVDAGEMAEAARNAFIRLHGAAGIVEFGKRQAANYAKALASAPSLIGIAA